MSDKPRKKHDDDDGNPMPAEAFKEWRKKLGLKQKDAADLLGLKKRMIQYYETGSRSGKHVSIPKSVRLACYALEAGVADYDGEHVLGDPPVSRPFHHPTAALSAATPLRYSDGETVPRYQRMETEADGTSSDKEG